MSDDVGTNHGAVKRSVSVCKEEFYLRLAENVRD